MSPLADWPYPDTAKERSPFAVTWTKTRDTLLREADYLGVNVVVAEVDCSRRHLRQDGELRADARHPDAGGPRKGWARLDAARQLMEAGGLL